MIFGNSTDFAIEAYHEPASPKFLGFGRMCIHVQGTMLGDLSEDHCSLFDAVGCFRELANIIGTLWDKRFLDLSDAEVFNDLDSALFQDHGQSLEKMKADWNTLGKYVFLTNSGEQFDDSKTFIICRPEGFVRVLYKLRDDKFGSLSCGVMSFRTAAKAFVAWFDEQVQTTVVNTP